MNDIWRYRGEAVFSLFEELARDGHTSDFRVVLYDGADLLLIGSFDLDYYHEVEVIFEDVSYLQMGTSVLSMPRARYADFSEIPSPGDLDFNSEDRLYAILSDTHSPPVRFFIGAKDVKARKCKVYHYLRNNLQPGEEIWESRR